MSQAGAAYIFLDEGGNLDFSPSGTKFFTLSGVTTFRPFNFDPEMSLLKHDLLEQGLDIDYFHATEDKQDVRDKVFDIIERHLSDVRIDSVIVDKCKTGPSLRVIERFYPEMVGYLLKYVFNKSQLRDASQIIVMTDTLPVASKKKAIEKAIRQTMPKMISSSTPYRIIHRQSCSCFGLQLADYCNWAVYRKWDRNDTRSLDRIRRCVQSQFDIFRNGLIRWY